VCGRLERFGGDAFSPLIFIDFAHSPDSLERVLKILRAFKPVRLICVFGCGGERDRAKRPLMGQLAAQYADLVIVTSDNPRGERPAAIAREIMAGARDAARFTTIEDRTRAIETALAGAAAEDIVLIAGKGHETTQEIAGQRFAQSDQATVKKWLAERR
jgi:UDP-N-acetylmuramoyl-L-alanyl-D-glutamate--2,6-diaminopimelate ligase